MHIKTFIWQKARTKEIWIIYQVTARRSNLAWETEERNKRTFTAYYSARQSLSLNREYFAAVSERYSIPISRILLFPVAMRCPYHRCRIIFIIPSLLCIYPAGIMSFVSGILIYEREREREKECHVMKIVCCVVCVYIIHAPLCLRNYNIIKLNRKWKLAWSYNFFTFKHVAAFFQSHQSNLDVSPIEEEEEKEIVVGSLFQHTHVKMFHLFSSIQIQRDMYMYIICAAESENKRKLNMHYLEWKYTNIEGISLHIHIFWNAAGGGGVIGFNFMTDLCPEFDRINCTEPLIYYVHIYNKSERK